VGTLRCCFDGRRAQTCGPGGCGLALSASLESLYKERMTARRGTAASTKRMEKAAGRLATSAVQRMSDELEWFRELAPEHRSWVGLVAQSAIAAFVKWQQAPEGEVVRPVFGVAPRALARVVSLQQTVQLVRVMVDVVEEAVPDLAAAGEEAALREGVLRFSREIAFAAAQVYASAAEERGAWHARSRALLVEGLVRGDPAEVLDARAAALGWQPAGRLVVAVGGAPPGEAEIVLDDVEHRCRALGVESLAGLHGERLVVLLAADPEPKVVPALAELFAPGPVVVGPVVDSLAEVTRSARAALSALRVAPAWPDAPRPVGADELLPERALDGDVEARTALVEQVHTPLAADSPVFETLLRYLGEGRSVEATARATFLHANTVRYRLRKVAQTTGYDPLEPRAAYVLQVAATLGRLAAAQ